MTSTPETDWTPEAESFEAESPETESRETESTPETESRETESSPETDSTPEAESTPDTVVQVEAESAPALVEIDPDVARELALSALREITPAPSIGEFADSSVNADGVLTMRFTNRLSGYPNWFWTVSLAQVEGSEASVLEVELLPGDGALLAPDWVPWAERLADYQAAQVALAAEGLIIEELDDESDDELDDVEDLDASDFDEDASPILHSGDVDGVDIDELDESDNDDDESDDDESDDDDDFDDVDRDIDEDRSY